MIASFIIIFFSLLFSAFFSGMEIAFISANRLKIELDRKQKSASSKIIALFTKNPGQYISTMLVGNNIALVIYGVVIAQLVEPLIELYITSSGPLILLIQTIPSTLLIIVTAEFLPKTVFRQNSNFFLHKLAFPVLVFYVIFYPIALLTVNFSNTIIRVFTKKGSLDQNPKLILRKIDLHELFSIPQ